MSNKIWCLFSILNEYDQPDNDLVAWWSSKPSFETLSAAINVPFKGDENILAVVKVHQGEEQRIGNTDYRLIEVQEGIVA